MSRNKKSRKLGRLMPVLAAGPGKAERLADPDSRESRRKRALRKKRRQQRSHKLEAMQGVKGRSATDKAHEPRLRHDPKVVAEASQALIEQNRG